MPFPLTVNIDENLKVHVYVHELFLGDRDRLCWTYLTDGFDKLGQREMSLSLLIEESDSEDDYPKTPIRLFQLLAQRISEDRHVDYGDSHRLGQKGIFGFNGAYYVPAIQYDNLPALENYLAVILVHDQEFGYARQFGLTRFLSRLGKYCSSFPYPTWNTSARPSLFPDESVDALDGDSLLTNARIVAAEHSYVELTGSQIVLKLHRRDSESLSTALSRLGPGESVIINCAYSPTCDASLYWEPGQKNPGAFASTSRLTGIIGGSFLEIARADASEADIREDGFSVSLKDADWKVLSSAISKQTGMTAPLNGGGLLELKPIFKAPEAAARSYQPVAVWKNLGDS